jgi:hypothetical protein
LRAAADRFFFSCLLLHLRSPPGGCYDKSTISAAFKPDEGGNILQKIIAALLSAVLLFSLTACGNSGISQQQLDQSTPAPTASGGSSGKPAYSNEIIVGSTTQLNSDFAEGWTNGTSNKNVKDLIFGYKTVAYTEEGRFIIDPTVVEKHESTDNPDGTKTHVMTIRQGLTYNDGTAITAKDYVFYLLNGSSPQFAAIEADNTLGIARYGNKAVYCSAHIDLNSQLSVVDIVFCFVKVKAGGLKENMQPFSRRTVFHIATTKTVYNTLGNRFKLTAAIKAII